MITKTIDVEELVGPEWPALVSADRCDADSVAQAFVRLVKGSQDLILCAHHFSVNEPLLMLAGWSVREDKRDTVNAKPSPSANAI